MFKRNMFYKYMDEANDDGAGGGKGGTDDGGSNNADDGNKGGKSGNDDGVKPFYSTLPETWRDDLINGLELDDDDVKEKRLGQLGRFTDMPAMVKSLFNAEDTISKHTKAQGLPDDPTDDQLAEYRKDNDIPEKPEDYVASLEDGLVLGEEDERILSKVYEIAHANNLSNDVVNQLTNAHLTARQVEEDAMQTQDGVDNQTTNATLRESWGNDYKTNINMVKGLLNGISESVREDFMNARLSDGKAVFNSPEIMLFMADIARKLNPAGTVIPNNQHPNQAIDEEIKTLEARMSNDDWHSDDAAQARLRQLYNAQENMKAIS